jgi:hypothetical protein
MPDQHSHEFDCRICGEHFHSQQELERHNRDEHTRQASGIGGNIGSNPTSDGMSRNGRGSIDEA